MEKLSFLSDYNDGAHPAVLRALAETNGLVTPGYGEDAICDRARALLREACACPGAAVWFLSGGTQTNATVIDAFLRPWQGAIAAETGHINGHEAGAVEATGHKVLPLPQRDGKIAAADLRAWLRSFYADESRDHVVQPGMVYISQPTEYGTLYSLAELEALSALCREYALPLYADGARLAYALACPANDVTLPDLARLCDAFYVGGTKCGALLGEAVVIPRPEALPHFFTVMKRHGAVLAKGRVLGVQFEALFADGLYYEIGRRAVELADRLRAALMERGYVLPVPSPTNQIFVSVDAATLARLREKAAFNVWELHPDGSALIRLVVGCSTPPEDVEALIALL